MRVAFICNEYPPRPHGGIGTFVRTLAPALIERGLSVDVVELGEAPGVAERCGVRVVTVGMGRRHKGAWILDRWRLKRYLERACYDAVEAPDFEGLVPWGLTNTALVSRLHLSSSARCIAEGVTPRRTLRWRERATLSKSDGWIAVSQASLRSTELTFPGIATPQCRTIFCPLHVEPENDTCPRVPSPFLLFAGYVSRSKGADRLARVVRPVLEEHPSLRLVYAGTITDAGGVRRGMREVVLGALGPVAAERCDLLGFVERSSLHGMMRQALALVFPSPLETFGLVAGEAMMVGCPVLLPREPPFTEYVRDEETGLLCDDDASWTHAVRRIVRDGHLRERLGQAGQRAATARFSVARCAADTIEFYRHLLLARSETYAGRARPKASARVSP